MIITYLRRTERAENIIVVTLTARGVWMTIQLPHVLQKRRRLNNLFFDLINDLGFKNCVRKFHPEPIRTHKHNKSTYPWEIDHMFYFQPNI